jgi:tRNA-2-methylthio-N6-dimethylallyladenosine synthase
VSKPADLIVEEVRRLVASGVPEVMLLGQNVNSYGNDRPGEPDFAELLALVNGVPGLERIRFTTSHPWDCTDALVESFSGHLNTLCEYFHLPVQSGSNSMLEKMRRGYTIESYLERIDALRAACPEIAMSTDIIVGFPGETEEQHAATIELLKTVRYESIFAFTYSERPGTAAARLVDDVPLPVKKARLKEVLELQNAITHARLQERFDGTTVEVLVEGLSSKASRPEVDAMFSSQLTGRTRTNVVVNFDRGGDTSFKVGDVVEVAIDEVNSHSLHGRVVRTVRSARAA